MYDVDRSNVVFNAINNNNQKNVEEIYFNSPVKTGNRNVDTGKLLLYEAANPKGAVVFVHGIGNKNLNFLKYYANILRKNNYTTVMPVLPYHYERTPRGFKGGTCFLDGTDEEISKRVEHAVVDICTCLDLLNDKGYKKINIIGVSSGGIFASIAMAVDKRIDKGVFIATGGNFEFITWKSCATKILKLNYGKKYNCHKKINHKLYKESNILGDKYQHLNHLDSVTCCFAYDSCAFSSKISKDKVLMFSAIFDEFISRRVSNELWNRLGRPKRYKLFTGHSTCHFLYKRYISEKVLEFLGKDC